MQGFPILQSGFIASSNKGLKLPEPAIASLQNAIMFKDDKDPLAKYRFSPVVGDLYHRWASNTTLLRDFDFRHEILAAAFVSFGTYNFHSWLMLQNEQPTLSDLHRAYLLETLDYLFTDNQRKINNVSWLRMLEASGDPNGVFIDIRKYFRQDGMGYSSSEIKLPTNLRDILRIWTSKERGFEDLLLSLYVIFGDRRGRPSIGLTGP